MIQKLRRQLISCDLPNCNHQQAYDATNRWSIPPDWYQKYLINHQATLYYCPTCGVNIAGAIQGKDVPVYQM